MPLFCRLLNHQLLILLIIDAIMGSAERGDCSWALLRILKEEGWN